VKKTDLLLGLVLAALAGGDGRGAEVTVDGTRYSLSADGGVLVVDGREMRLGRVRDLEVTVRDGQAAARVNGSEVPEVADRPRLLRVDRFPADRVKSLAVEGLAGGVEVSVEEGRADVAVSREGDEEEICGAAVWLSGRCLRIRGKAGFQPRVKVAVPPGIDVRTGG
jgi:hypothetical protein